jgi:tetratricopeptide (TPR) repeat protein
VGWVNLAGRDEPLAVLRSIVDSAVTGRGRLVLVTGEAGIGKTTLAVETARHAETAGARALWGAAWPGADAPGYWPWVQVLRALAGRAHTSLADLVPAAAAQFEVFDAVSSTVLVAAAARPLVVVLDDLHWADVESLRLAQFLARRVTAAPVLVLGTCRDVEVEPSDPRAGPLAELAALGTTVPLGPLGPEAVTAVMSGLLGGAPPPDLAQRVYRRTGGNPLFVEQVTRLVAARPDGPVPVPDGVRDAIDRRLRRLDPRCLDLLRTAALFGGPVAVDVLAHAAGQPATGVFDLLTGAVRAGVVAADGHRYRFVHDLYREVLDGELAAADRARRHGLLAAALREQPDAEPARLAAHLLGAGEYGEALPHCVAAARDAGRRLAYGEEVTHWLGALRAGGTDSDRAALLLGLAGARRRSGDLPGAREACLRAADHARRNADAQRLGEAALGLHAVGTESLSTRTDVIAALEEAAAALSTQDTPTRARVLACLARDLAWHGVDVPRGVALAAEAVALARAIGDRPTLAACLLAQHNAGWAPGTAAARLAVTDEILALANDLADRELLAEARLLRTTDLLELADPRALDELARFGEVAAASNQPRLRYAVLVREATVALMVGRFADAERLVDEAVALGTELGEPDVDQVRFTQLVELREAQGRLADLVPDAGRYYPPGTPQARWLAAMVCLERGDEDGARAAAAPLRATPPEVVPRDRLWFTVAGLASTLTTRLRDRPGCEAWYDALLPFASAAVVSGAGIGFGGAVAHHLGVLAAVLDRVDAARAHLEQALAVHERLGADAWVLRTRAELAALAGSPRLSGVFLREGTQWTLRFAGTGVRVADAKGLHDIAALLGRPGVAVHVDDLVGVGSDGRARLGADPVLDARARREYRSRLADLAEEVEEAEAWHDPERAARARDERDAILAELTASTGLGGRYRRLGDETERARKAVAARVRDALRRIEAVHPALAAHLRASVSTGTRCVYQPAAPVDWQT